MAEKGGGGRTASSGFTNDVREVGTLVGRTARGEVKTRVRGGQKSRGGSERRTMRRVVMLAKYGAPE